MDDKKISTVKREIKRFLEKEKELAEAKAKAKYTYDGRQYEGSCPKESGALRRASMDLTRALADLRKP